jgi:hypothetical protein
MPMQPLEIYDVEETGELVLKHKDLKDALITSNAIMIINHDDKTVIIWIGKGASTRIKFASARASRRLLTDRGLSYRVKTCDEGEEPDWFQALFAMKVTERSRDEPPTLEVLSILNEMKAEKIPEGYQREACIITRDFYVPIEYKSSLMGADTSSIKFEKGDYLPEGFFMLPSGAYSPRLLVKNGKVLGIDILINLEFFKKDALIESLQQENSSQKAQIESLQTDLTQKDQQLTSLQEETENKDNQIKSIQIENKEKDAQIETLQGMVSERDTQIEDLQSNVTQKDQQIETLQGDLSSERERIQALQSEMEEKDQRIETLQSELTEKDIRNEALQNSIQEKDQQIEISQNEISDKNTRIESLNQQIQELNSSIEEKEQTSNEKEKIIKQKDKEIQKEQKLRQKEKNQYEEKIKELESLIEPNQL